ncbi:MAG: alginate lyase family protein [Pseudomonadota bacterium]|nr:alginate lyase family protein [Pseudomonadota bacterium]
MQEVGALPDRYRGPPGSILSGDELARVFGASNIDGLWMLLAEIEFPAVTTAGQANKIAKRYSEEAHRIEIAAKQIMSGSIKILAYEKTVSNLQLDWSQDFVSGYRWPKSYFRDLDLNDLSRASDVKVPWELSRMQWLIPVGQHYLISGDEACAEFAAATIADWISQNPYGRGVNWGIAMEAAMRIITWSWFFHVFATSRAWDESGFRESFLKSMYDHAIFCRRFIEDYGSGGNHMVADATGLIISGVFFGCHGPAESWARIGWDVLQNQISAQVGSDGANLEGSCSYHRFVAELLVWAVRLWKAAGNSLSPQFAERLDGMAKFTAAYMRPDGQAPAWGDNDNGRVLPFGGQHTRDHSYIPALITASLDVQTLPASNNAAKAELWWSLGSSVETLDREEPKSMKFKECGIYVMASGGDHVFIDCGPVGSGGRGGHGHNDCLSLEACLKGFSLLTDSGSYVYTSSAEWRNRMRGSGAHNAPVVDGQEANRLVNDWELFLLRNDATPDFRQWSIGEKFDRFIGAHFGYGRLSRPVTPVRTVVLDKLNHRLAIQDAFEGQGEHDISITLHIDPAVELAAVSETEWRLLTASEEFRLIFISSETWNGLASESWYSESYGAKVIRPCIRLQRQGVLSPVSIGIFPLADAPADPFRWLNNIF